MVFKKIFTGIFLIVFLFCPVIAHGQGLGMTRVYKFKDVIIPFKMKYGKSIMEKGKYEFEIMFNRGHQVFYLKIIKKRKGICLVPGDRKLYKSYGRERVKDPNIPLKPTLNIKKVPESKRLMIIFEAGKEARMFRYALVIFNLEYEE
jgi:hypothetical protein